MTKQELIKELNKLLNLKELIISRVTNFTTIEVVNKDFDEQMMNLIERIKNEPLDNTITERL